MTQAATPLRKEHTGNGVATNFLYDWQIDANTELLVTKVTIATGAEETLAVGVGYTVTGVGNPNGGNVVISPALSSAYKIVITSNIPYQQDTDFTNQNSVKPEEIEFALDKLSRQIKQLAESFGRAVKTSVGSTVTPDELIEDINTKAASIVSYSSLAQAWAEYSETWGVYAGQQAALLPKNNYTATTDPTVDDDSSDGYLVGSSWINTSTGDRFQCTNTTVGAAVWVEVSRLSPSDVGTMAFEAATDYVLKADVGTMAAETATDYVLKADVGTMAAEAATDYFLKSEVATIRQIPQNSKSANYTLVLTDGGKHIFYPAPDGINRTWTIPANASVAFPVGTAITFVSQSGAGSIFIVITSDTMRLAGTNLTGTRTLAPNNVATALKITATDWIIYGTTGLT